MLQKLDSRPISTSTTLSDDSFTPPVPQRPSSSVLESIRQEREFEELRGQLARDAGHGPADISHGLLDAVDDVSVGTDQIEDEEGDYQEIDDNHESKYEPRKMGPPQVRIERRMFPRTPLESSVSMVSSAAGSEEMLDRDANRTFEPLAAKKSSNSGSKARNGPPLLQSHSRDTSPKPADVPPSPRAVPPSTLPTFHAFLPHDTSSQHSDDDQYPYHQTSHTVSALATLPRRRKDKAPPVYKREYEVQTLDRRLPAREAFERSHSERGRPRPIPPTPPLRRLPSWVGIYTHG